MEKTSLRLVNEIIMKAYMMGKDPGNGTWERDLERRMYLLDKDADYEVNEIGVPQFKI